MGLQFLSLTLFRVQKLPQTRVGQQSQTGPTYSLEQCRNSKRTWEPRNMSTGMGSLICSAQRGLLLWYSTSEWYWSEPGSPEPAAT